MFPQFLKVYLTNKSNNQTPFLFVASFAMDKVDIIIRTVDVKDQLSSIKTLIDSFVAKGATAPNSFFTELVQRVTQDDVVIQVALEINSDIIGTGD